MIKMSHLRDLVTTDNIGESHPRSHTEDSVAITHRGKKDELG